MGGIWPLLLHAAHRLALYARAACLAPLHQNPETLKPQNPKTLKPYTLKTLRPAHRLALYARAACLAPLHPARAWTRGSVYVLPLPISCLPPYSLFSSASPPIQ